MCGLKEERFNQESDETQKGAVGRDRGELPAWVIAAVWAVLLILGIWGGVSGFPLDYPRLLQLTGTGIIVFVVAG